MLCACARVRVCACVCVHARVCVRMGATFTVTGAAGTGEEPAPARGGLAHVLPPLRGAGAPTNPARTRARRAHSGTPHRPSPEVPYPTSQTPLCPSCPCSHLGLGRSDADRRGGSRNRSAAAAAGTPLKAHGVAGARASLTRVLGGGAQHSPNPAPVPGGGW